MSRDTKRVKRGPNFCISAVTSAAIHPLGVKPSGNALLDGGDLKNQRATREKNLGKLASFPEQLLMELLSYITDPKTLQNLGFASRMLYAYTYEEEIWRKLYMSEYVKAEKSRTVEGLRTEITLFGADEWRGTWRKTLLRLEKDQEAAIQCKNILFSDLLYRPYQCSQIDYEHVFKRVIEFEKLSCEAGYNMNPEFGIDRFDESKFTCDKFTNEYVDKPFIIQTKEENRWPKWDLDYLVNSYPEVIFRQESVKWTLSHYFDYCKANRDESPLYLFDCKSQAMEKIKNEYKSPQIFQDDYFKLFQENDINCRPDHRWLIVGPARSGSTFHKDPNQTSAWNATLSGMKLWVMFPPNIKPPGVSTEKEEEEVTSPVSMAEWVISGYYNDAVKMAQKGQCLIGITFSRECIYVPSGWWHAVINLTDSVALTENFVSLPILPRVLNFLKNKTEQISGFHFKDLSDSIETFLKHNGNTMKDQYHKELLQEFIDRGNLEKFTNEDCGVLKLNGIKPPIYVFLIELIFHSESKEHLDTVLKELKLIELGKLGRKLQTGRENIGESELWNNITTKESNLPFSFGFHVE